jgi:predicted ATPase
MDHSPVPLDPAAPGALRWQVRLLGAVEAFDGVQRIQRFPSRAVAALLARLALAPDRAHPREELVELLWPGVALDVGRNRLRQALSTLKSLLEPAGQAGHGVLQADRLAVRVVRGALGCDALDFERRLRSGHAAEAQALWGGEFMPGYYDEWVNDERQRLAALQERIGTPPAATTTPAAAPAAAAPGPAPLPSYLTRLFGAEMAAARLRAAVLAQRLVTLLGPGGSGKTRLAVEVAQSLCVPPAFARVVFVSLVACDEAAPLHDALARALQQRGGGGDVDSLVQALAGQRVLLVLDNFEQLVGRAEGVVATLLARLPALHVLVTSRRALGLDGEQQLGAEPLLLPDAETSLAAAAANPAVALFVDRARAARADFHLGERNHAAIVALVRALHGLPLAIELAASRVRSVPPAEMVALLQAGDGAQLALLARSGPRAGHDPRHASMAQVIAWSWRLLDEPAQRLMAALTLFPTDAAPALLAAMLGQGLAATAVQLDGLVAHSLVRAHADETARFALQEPVREFVLATVPADQLQALRARQRQALLQWAEALPPHTPPARLAPELPAVHAVLATPEAPRVRLQLALALRRYWETDGLPLRLLDALEAALPAADADSAMRADAHELLAHLRMSAGQSEAALQHAQAALEAAGADPARRSRALLRRVWSQVAFGRVDERADPLFRALCAQLDEALALARDCGQRELQARALQYQAVLWCNVHLSSDDADPVRAEALFAQSEALWLALGDTRQARDRQRNRAQCWAALGRKAEAMAVYQRCEQAARDDGDWVGQIDNQISLCTMLADQRRWAEALDACRRSIRVASGRWHHHGLAYGLWNIARPLAHLRQPQTAMRLMAFATRFWTDSMGPLRADDQRYLRRVRRLVQLQMGDGPTDAAWHEGLRLDLGGAVAEALNDVRVAPPDLGRAAYTTGHQPVA